MRYLQILATVYVVLYVFRNVGAFYKNVDTFYHNYWHAWRLRRKGESLTWIKAWAE
jgi:hypothetical protein